MLFLDMTVQATPLQYQHRIAVAVKTISPADCFLISPQHQVPRGKGKDHGKQRAARQVKICDQRIDISKPVRRIDKQVRKTLPAAELSIPADSFQFPCTGRAHRHYPPAGTAGTFDRPDRPVTDVVPFTVHLMIPKAPGTNRPERP